MTSLLTDRFQRGQQEGDLDDTVEAGELARYFHMVFNGLCVYAGGGASREQLRACAARV
ncbi:hypothetical protein [Acerihabitans sp.]|uniref:hypothetical protein n=1 Tax=Acerihabitans sp. TaxID=2811394 RepID=UPI002EDA8EA8